MSKGYFNEDMRIFMDNRVDWARLFELRGGDVPAAEELETYKMILGSVGDIAEDLEEAARGHWHEEPVLTDGRVVVPAHMDAAYQTLKQNGMVCLTLSPDYGGYGLPMLLNTFYLEMISRADASLMTVVGLQGGVAGDIEKYGSDAIKKEYLPRFVSGELQGAMDLTEPEAGSDLGGIATRATLEDGRYFLDGEKIFITNGGADVHLVLARDNATFDETRGTTDGLDLLLCPVVLADGTRNSVRVIHVERKLGIHGSATCTVEFDHAEAFLLGEVGQGFRAMLDLMNNARLGVAGQAIGIAEAAYREARTYTEERKQFGGSISEQPLVKSMLTLMAINIESARALLYRTCALIDITEAIRRRLATDGEDSSPELATELAHNSQVIRFLTPLCKYYAAEISNTVTRKGVQLHGGTGYMAETAAGHHHCDSIITAIYEGTSEIQATFALKEMAKGTLLTVLEDVGKELDALPDDLSEQVEQVRKGIEWINSSLPALMGDPSYALLNAKRVCQMIIDVIASVEIMMQIPAAPEKLALATVFINRRMPAVEMNARRISSGDASRIERYNEVLDD